VVRDGAVDRAVWTRVSLGADRPLHLLAARFVHHRFAPHAHEEFAIGACSTGVETIRYRGTEWATGPGTLVVVEPGESHTGGPAAPTGFAYRALYPAADLVTDASGAPQPHFRTPVIEDAQLAGELRRTHLALSRGGDALAIESRLTWLLATLVHRHTVATIPAPTAGVSDRVAATTMARLADQLVDPPTLQEIAAELGLSRFQVVRAFRQTVGMPPYAWLAQHRVTRARALLEAGGRPAQVAGEVGFADQAHLTRWFRRVLGVTPGAFRNSVQDSCRRPHPD
jgi:AraC-like DNA-binding protein